VIERAHLKGDAESLAVYSDCERYRYLLTRVWEPGRKALFVMLNPSTATEVQNDPTVERCERRARPWASARSGSATSSPGARHGSEGSCGVRPIPWARRTTPPSGKAASGPTHRLRLGVARGASRARAEVERLMRSTGRRSTTSA
jgi:hypothetical protein